MLIPHQIRSLGHSVIGSLCLRVFIRDSYLLTLFKLFPLDESLFQFIRNIVPVQILRFGRLVEETLHILSAVSPQKLIHLS